MGVADSGFDWVVRAVIGDVLRQSIFLLLLSFGGPLLASACVGLLISFIQAATQIQEQTTLFVFKLGAGGGVVVIGGAWWWSQMIELFRSVLFLVAHIGKS